MPHPDDFPLTRVTLSTGVTLDTVDIGPRDAPVLLFLHGFPESHRTWREQLPHFAETHRVIAPDQRGYRGSSKPTDVADYAPERIVADAFALMDALGVGRFTVVGHDWGGAVTWGVALANPERVERLVILNAPHPAPFQRALFDDMEQRASSQYITAFRDTSMDATIREQGLVPILLKAVSWDRSPALSDDERARMLADWSDGEAAIAMLNWYRATSIVVPPMEGPEPPRPAFLSAPFPPVTVPTVVIWATDDRALRPSLLDGLDELVNDLTVVKVPGCGHFVPWEAPGAVNRAIREWLGA